ncbi:SRPBCC domain-containing protein [Sphingomonas sp.]|jgi:uncharacterized protein YndB with AHSA1/START domain|uniref:SRPBCC family protein n=1 Tax=Sphingomonas sp. TaxID=28214 RepID=UPI002DB81989|nr:SRPBCC domain-containing protein [Sphingomonas sp.]HEU4968777.1 SRPBCC domain-containing protein [Sphingomonas sp.]
MRQVVLIAASLSLPASAAVVADNAAGFAIEHEAVIAASPERVYAALGQPSAWWNSQHSWSGSASNLSLDLRPGGCFCERLPGGGGVEHARVVMAWPGKLLRLSGALGPLQSEALTGTMSWELKPVAGGTSVKLSYVVAGLARTARAALPGAVDGVLGEQLAGLKTFVEGRAKGS